MKKTKKTIISCAITGSVHTPSMSEYLPVTPEQIADAAVGAIQAGAAIVHLHARDPQSGKPTQSPDVFAKFLPVIGERCDGIVNITTGGGLGMTMDERLAAAKWARPELASMNMGSMNFNLAGAAGRIQQFKHDWEEKYLSGTVDYIMSNTFAQIERGMRELGDLGTRFEFECYDVSHLYNLAHFVERQIVKPPFFIQSIFGVLGGIGGEAENFMHMRATADRLFGDDYVMSVLGGGRLQFPFCTMSAIMGGHVRVGMEDNLFIAPRQLAKTNAEQVEKMKRILAELSIEPATPDEARAILGTKGKAAVGF